MRQPSAASGRRARAAVPLGDKVAVDRASKQDALEAHAEEDSHESRCHRSALALTTCSLAEFAAQFDTSQPNVVYSDDQAVEDDRLRLIFTCCHPALAPEAQVGLTLRTLCGLGTEEIARAFLVPVPTLAQRLVRAKQKIRAAGIPHSGQESGSLRRSGTRIRENSCRQSLSQQRNRYLGIKHPHRGAIARIRGIDLRKSRLSTHSAAQTEVEETLT